MAGGHAFGAAHPPPFAFTLLRHGRCPRRTTPPTRRWCSCTASGRRSNTVGARAGWIDLIGDAGRTVVPVDILGHGTAARPHDPAAYADLETERRCGAARRTRRRDRLLARRAVAAPPRRVRSGPVPAARRDRCRRQRVPHRQHRGLGVRVRTECWREGVGDDEIARARVREPRRRSRQRPARDGRVSPAAAPTAHPRRSRARGVPGARHPRRQGLRRSAPSRSSTRCPTRAS